MNIITLIKAARLRTLPLSVSGIIVGSALAYRHEAFSSEVLIWALITTVLLQILSNFANDYGDGVKGTDNAERVGPKRAVQSGSISAKQMKRVVLVTAGLSLVSAMVLIYTAFGKDNWLYVGVFLVLGLLCIAAAIKYTVGKSAYGYRGLGDVFVFVFFGLVSVIGSEFLYTQELKAISLLPATAVGLLSVAVLNLNNMRDEASDRRAGKHTLVVKMGLPLAKYYHYYLVVLAMVSMLCFSVLRLQTRWQLLYILAFVPLTVHLLIVKRNTDTRELDSQLKVVALSTFVMAVLFFIGQIYY
ncbi:1,4-dihydroxy-2-naphthoate octaprenyltransferase [Capnocytophaga sp. oral taxon 878]|uniref:1,4-dihydroxy-2-naphthoate octaprenyltransferase n=1 Tax=Capnocytophaga sp. oral taxon 878 TaxID=1316596 RepID=UPI000D036166|nr:1,4-dihydroxy-2-naphthoate octaprenyltransferase [Capnocytophaga sp. oral taxon 878]AVM50930.1 1,4-dihydroxy-2-naphthoate octaprenyltransferase [Capnocytophaga sp. oral taxon 878]